MKITLILFISVGSILITFSVGGIQIISTTRASINEVGEWIELKDQIINHFNIYLYKKDKQQYYLLTKSIDRLKTIDSMIDNFLSGQLDINSAKDQLSKFDLPETENNNINFLMRYYSYFPGIKNSISHWKRLNESIQKLDILINQVQKAPLNQLTDKARKTYLQQIYHIDQDINFEEHRLRSSLSQSAEWVKDTLIWALIITGLFLLTGVSSIIIFFHYRIQWWHKTSIENRKWYQSLFKYNPYPILSIDTSGAIQASNPSMTDLLGYKEKDLYQKSFISYYPEPEKEKLEKYFDKTLEGNPQHFETYQFDKSGKKVVLQTTLVPIYINQDIQGVHAMKKDITAKKYMEEQLSVSERKFRQLFQNAPFGIVFLDKHFRVVDINQKFTQIFGYTFNDIKGQPVNDYVVPEDQLIEAQLIDDDAQENVYKTYETLRKRKDGSIIDVFLGTVPVIINDEIIGIFGLYLDITHQKNTERDLKSSLQEKEILLQEIHHRVKNNLAIIVGLLELQIENSFQPEVNKKLRASQRRIYSMAAIHELIYKNENFLTLPFDDYLRKMISDFRKSGDTSNSNITIKTSLDSIYMNVNQAIPFAILFNEIFSNAWEHAFKNREWGTIDVELSEKEDHIYLDLKDNGIGLPQNISFNHMETMGMELIQSLVQQLDANINFKVANGTHINIGFKKSHAAGSSSTLQ